MKTESGRSLIEIIGVLAVIGIMSASAIAMYKTIKNNQTRKFASVEIEELAKNTKILLELRGDYTGVSLDYLVNAGALKSKNAPIGSNNWSVEAYNDGKAFVINLTDLNKGDCEYFVSINTKWAKQVLLNGVEKELSSGCFSTNTNKVSFVVE